MSDLFDLPIAHERIMTDSDRARLELDERQRSELAGIAGVVSAAGLLPHVDMDKPEEITEAVRKLRAKLKWFEERAHELGQAVDDAMAGQGKSAQADLERIEAVAYKLRTGGD